ncbi:Uncharacterised protein [Mycobacteroides abscessus subsp. abscessus]|uniref:hypothetical protein n=1 Tax=Mycobacteroides abscessus TaxID=36809 RepID=UPI00092A05BD|nr:hypothetical protein [Mycobacteroides abscessus]SIM06708.1 Uncharacterised protein [Mycobacteroides abscessus subsp. abscessus]SKT51658.1 Uncharacterised protein [Mycobacteroides abscessus subsp. massiliense]SLC77033.1 Uncharacterised protein [Mycobacteroides abscessus subsp. abscessus]
MDLYKNAVELGFTAGSSARDIVAIAGALVDERGYPESVHDTTRSLMRIQRQLVTEQAGAA